jgi:peptide/nickel transport system substrate-binding protein
VKLADKDRTTDARAGDRWRRRAFALALAMVAVAGSLDLAEDAAQSGRPGDRASAPRTLVVATASDAITINPLDVSIVTPDTQMTRNLYDHLVELDRDGRPVPALATAWARINPTTIRFQLRPGVKFHHGEDFTAEDVRFTFDAVRDPAQKYKQAGSFSFIDRVEVLDRFTVQLVTKQPEAAAIRMIEDFGIVSAAYTKAHPAILNTKPNGTGAYRFVEWVKDDHLTMEAFPGYWRGAAAIPRVTWRAIKDDAARVAALVAGEIDVAHSVPTDLIPLVARSGRAEVRPVAAMRSYWLMLVNTRPDFPTAKKEVRQAINYAIDRDELNRALFGGQALPLATAIHPQSLGYDPRHTWPYDPAKAKELLARAGYPHGFTIGLHASSGQYARDRELSQAIAGQLARVGITVRVQNLEVGQFTDGVFKKTTDPLVLLTFGDPDHDRTTNFSISHRTGQLWSVISYPQLDALITRAEGTLDDAARAEVLREAQAWMMENAPAAYLLTLVDIYGVNKTLKWQPRPDDVLSWREAAFAP